jgi:tetratricopeptide (TPR) repeat protein
MSAMLRTLCFLSLPLLCACAASSPATQAKAPALIATRTAAAPPAPVEARPATALAQPEERTQGEVELALWNDPAFRRALVESYLAETELEPKVLEEEREPLSTVLELVSKDRLAEAAREVALLATPTASAVFDFTKANIHLQREELTEAAAGYQVAVEKFPKFRRAWKNLALVRLRRGEFEPARRAFTRVLELGGGDGFTYGLLAFTHANLGHPLAAESAYRQAVLLDPATPDWKMGLAKSFFDQKRFADAAALCGEMLAADPERHDLWLLQANAFLGQGQAMRAAENYELLERMGSSSVASLNSLGDIYVNEGLHELAVRSYVAALERFPEATPERALRAAKVMSASGAREETKTLSERIQALRGATLAEGERKDLLKLRARIAVAEGAGEEEARVLEEIVALDPLDGEALLLLGQHAARGGDAEKAAFYYERAAGLEKFEADAKVRHAQLLVGQGRYAEALPLLRRAQQLQPRDSVADYLKGVERAAQGR